MAVDNNERLWRALDAITDRLSKMDDKLVKVSELVIVTTAHTDSISDLRQRVRNVELVAERYNGRTDVTKEVLKYACAMMVTVITGYIVAKIKGG